MACCEDRSDVMTRACLHFEQFGRVEFGPRVDQHSTIETRRRSHRHGLQKPGTRNARREAGRQDRRCRRRGGGAQGEGGGGTTLRKEKEGATPKQGHVVVSIETGSGAGACGAAADEERRVEIAATSRQSARVLNRQPVRERDDRCTLVVDSGRCEASSP